MKVRNLGLVGFCRRHNEKVGRWKIKKNKINFKSVTMFLRSGSECEHVVTGSISKTNPVLDPTDGVGFELQYWSADAVTLWNERIE